MKLDNTLSRIIITIQEEVKEKFNKEYSIEELHDVIDSQLEATKLGFTKGISVHWHRFCKFIYTDRANRKKHIYKQIERLVEDDVLTPQEIESIRKQLIIDSEEIRQDKIKKDSLRHGVPLTGKAIVDKDSVKSSDNFTFINLKSKRK